MSNTAILAYSGDAKLWFAQLDSYLTAHSVYASEQKLNVFIRGIPATLSITVKDIIIDPLQGKIYDFLKTKVQRRNPKSSESRFCSLLQDEYLSAGLL